MSALFVVVYAGCNWITAQRTDVGTIFFEWERHIPFLPLLIAPYLSIDLFFVAAPFLCRSERELSTFARRVAAAIVMAGICFLALPFRFAFTRPHADGWIGAVFDWFRAMDAPFNLFPSLHIALSALLIVTYARHTRGAVRAAIVVWFFLIILSAVFTYQHHVLDVIGGFALAGYCFYFIRESQSRTRIMAEKQIGFYYAIAAALLLAGAIFFWPWGALLLWPMLALAIAAAGYFGIGPAIYRKTSAALPWSASWALGPVLAGQHLSRLWYRRNCEAWDAVTPQVWIGSAPSRREARAAVAAGVTAVLDLTAEFSAARQFRGLHYLNIPMLDLTAPTSREMEKMARFIAAEAEHGIVYVHCKIGYSRSAAAVAAYLLRSGQARDAESAFAQIRRVRPSLVVRAEARRAVVRFQKEMEICARV